MHSVYIWVDVRDLAVAHVNAMESPDAVGKRFFVTEGYFSNKKIIEAIRKNFPEYQSQLPSESVQGGDIPEGGVYKINNRRSIEVLGLKYSPFEQCIIDTVKSFKAVGA
jgi:nucleoside-diphosphate-sugar epimerase